MRDAELSGFAGLAQRFDALAQQLLVADAGDETGVLLARGRRRDLLRAASIPSPVSAETATKSSGGSAARGKSDLLPTRI